MYRYAIALWLVLFELSAVGPAIAADGSVAVNSRLSAVDFDTLPPDQQKLFPRGFFGPGTVLVRSPEVMQRFLDLLSAIKASPTLSKPLAEISILTIARRLDSQFEWFSHTQPAPSEGIDPDVIDAIKHGRPPLFTDTSQSAVYQYTTAVLDGGEVKDGVFFGARDVLGERGLIDLTIMIGEYRTLETLIKVYGVPLPPGVQPSLPPRK